MLPLETKPLNRAGKLENIKKELQKNEGSVLGVREVRWKGQGETRNGDYIVYYTEGERAEKLAIVVHKSRVKCVVKKIVYNDRIIIIIKLQAEPISILMMEVYMPTSEHEDEVEELYYTIEEILEEGKGDINTIIMGDWSSAVGDESYRNIVGPHGLGRKNLIKNVANEIQVLKRP